MSHQTSGSPPPAPRLADHAGQDVAVGSDVPAVTDGPPSRPLTVTLWGLAVLIMAQAVLAGTFISGVGNLRMVHLVIGSILEYVGFAPAIIVGVSRNRAGIPRNVKVGSVLLSVGLFLQAGFGHMPMAWGTAVHVPFGSLLLVTAVVLAIRSARWKEPTPDHAA